MESRVGYVFVGGFVKLGRVVGLCGIFMGMWWIVGDRSKRGDMMDCGKDGVGGLDDRGDMCE